MCELCWLNVQINELVGPRGDQDALRSWACTELHRIYRHLRTTLHEGGRQREGGPRVWGWGGGVWL